MNATAAIGAAGALCNGGLKTLERLTHMQADMNHIAAGKLPIRPNGRNATAADVEAFLASRGRAGSSGPRARVLRTECG